MTQPSTGSPVLITGATGFIGEHLFRRLAAGHHPVVGLGRSRDVVVLRIPWVEGRRVDLRNRREVNNLMREVQPGAIYHCAAATDASYCEQHPEEARADIVDATRYLAQAVAGVAPDTPFIALSTDLVFDGEHAPYREFDPAQPVCVYGRLKLEAEQSVLELPHGVVLRSSLVYGSPSTHRASFLGWMVDALAGGRPLQLFSDEVRTPIFVDDLCNAMVALANKRDGAPGLWHAGGPQRLDRATIGRAVCRAYGLDDTLVRPVLLADSSYAAPRPRDVSLDSNRLWSRLAWRPRTLTEGLEVMAGAGDSCDVS